MPSIATQMYWHEAPNALPPWASEEQRMLNVTIARELKAEAISPIPLNGAYLVGNRERDAKRERDKIATARRQLANVGLGKLCVEPLLSYRCALNTVLSSLGALPMSCAECAAIINKVRGTLNQSDYPIVSCLQAMAASRGLTTRALTREELKHRRCTFFANDVPPGKRALFICSKMDPMFIAVYGEWLPMSRKVGRLARRGHNGAMRILCPAQQPRPWHKRIQVLSRIDRNETICLYVSQGDSEDGGAPVEAEASKKKGIAKNANKPPAKKAAAAGQNKNATEKATTGKQNNRMQHATAINQPVPHEPLSDIDSDDLDALIAADDENVDDRTDAADERWSDLDEEMLQNGVTEEELFATFTADMLFPPPSSQADEEDGGGGVRRRRRVPAASAPSSSLASTARARPIQPLELEGEANFADPFGLLPTASSLIITAVQESLKNMRARSSATWTQRILKLKDRQLLYNLAQSQLAMM